MALTVNGECTNKIVLKQKEGKLISFRYNVDISGASFALICKDKDGTTKISKDDTYFTIESADNIVRINLTTTDLDLPVGVYSMEVKAVWNSVTSVDKTVTMKLQIDQSLFS